MFAGVVTGVTGTAAGMGERGSDKGVVRRFAASEAAVRPGNLRVNFILASHGRKRKRKAKQQSVYDVSRKDGSAVRRFGP